MLIPHDWPDMNLCFNTMDTQQCNRDRESGWLRGVVHICELALEERAATSDDCYTRKKFNIYTIYTTAKELKCKVQEKDNNATKNALEYLKIHYIYSVNKCKYVCIVDSKCK